MKLAIYGAGGLGKEIYSLAILNYQYEEIIFIDDTKDNHSKINNTYSIKYEFFKNEFNNDKTFEIVIGVGEPYYREQIYNRIVEDKYKIGKLISKKTVLYDESKIGIGTIIFEFVSIHNNVNIGVNNVIYPNCFVAHDCNIGDHNLIAASSSIGGGSILGSRNFLGSNTAIKQRCSLGDDNIVGMGANIIHNILNNKVIVGNPGNVIRDNGNRKVFI